MALYNYPGGRVVMSLYSFTFTAVHQPGAGDQANDAKTERQHAQKLELAVRGIQRAVTCGEGRHGRRPSG